MITWFAQKSTHIHAVQSFSRGTSYRRTIGREEANAQWHAMLIIDEIYGIGNVRAGLFGENGADYVRIYGERKSGTISTFESALDQMATFIETERPSGHTGTYVQLWQNDYNANAQKYNRDAEAFNSRVRTGYATYRREMEEYNRALAPSRRQPLQPMQDLMPIRRIW